MRTNTRTNTNVCVCVRARVHTHTLTHTHTHTHTPCAEPCYCDANSASKTSPEPLCAALSAAGSHAAARMRVAASSDPSVQDTVTDL